MAIYHCSFKLVSRKGGNFATAAAAYVSGSKVVCGSAVAGAAYRSGEKIHNEYNDKTHDYTQKGGVIYAEIILPENAPEKFYDRPTLWNAVELKNKRKDAQLARECDIALPKELSVEQHKELVREFIHENFTDKGICADFAIHDKDGENPHVHIMFTMDTVTEKGFGNRLAEEQANKYYLQKKRLKTWRKEWANIANKHLEQAGSSERIDHRSLKDQGIDRIPTKHLGKAAHALEKKGKRTRKGDTNREIVSINTNLAELQKEIKDTDNYIYALKRYEADPAIRAQMLRLEKQNQQKAEYFAKEFLADLETLEQIIDGRQEQGGPIAEARKENIVHIAELIVNAETKLESWQDRNDRLKNINLSPQNSAALNARLLESELLKQKAEKQVQELKQKQQQRRETTTKGMSARERILEERETRRKARQQEPSTRNEIAERWRKAQERALKCSIERTRIQERSR